MPTVEPLLYAEPQTIVEALQALSDAGPGASPLAGGTDLIPRMRKGLIDRPTALVNLKAIPDLAGIRLDEENGEVVIGATASFAEIIRSELLAERVPLMSQVANLIGSPQIRNMATIGGNVCNASPAGDTIVPLIVYGAKARLWSLGDGPPSQGSGVASRFVPVEDLFTGPGATVIGPAELLGSLHMPLPAVGHRAACRKFRRRPTMDCAVVSVGIGAVVADDGILSSVRVAFGAVAPTARRGIQVEALLEGNTLGPALVAQARLAADGEVAPISDVRAGEDFRREIVGVLLERALRELGGEDSP